MKTILLTLLLVASGGRLLAQCTSTSRAEIKVAAPFAVSLGVPVAPLAPYYYSSRQFQTHASPPPGSFEPNAALWPVPRGQSSSALAAHCAACHSGPAPQGNIQLDHPAQLSIDERLAAIRAVAGRRMPQGKRLALDELRAVIEELAE